MHVKDGWNSNPVLHSMQASRDFRTKRRYDEVAREAAVANGSVFPAADDLLRGSPYFGAELALDMAHFFALLRRDFVADGRAEQWPALLPAVDRARATSSLEDVRIVARVLKEIADGDAGTLREERLRCRLYLGALGDSGAALELAMDAVTAAYRQEWHMVGDGSILVWTALGWLAHASASKSRDNLASGSAITPMFSPQDRVLSVAHDLRTRVERCVIELNTLGE